MFFTKVKEKFISGNDAATEAADAAGANFMSGYPITPATEILQNWAKLNDKFPQKYKFVQSEDETSAGFTAIGAVLAGLKAFTASAGPGHILLQDPLVMAEAMRIPLVTIIMQRGGPSTGTVIYSQQEVTLACFGGNGEGLRIVYSVSGVQDVYDYVIKAFYMAWKYRYPVIVLGDGYVAKMKELIKLYRPKHLAKSEKIIGKLHEIKNIRNCFNFENELNKVLMKNIKDYENDFAKITESMEYKCKDAETVIIAHGIVANSAMTAVDLLRERGIKVGLFRPITLRPFDYHKLSKIVANTSEVIICESAYGQLERLVKDKLYGLTRIKTFQKPVLAINPEDIIKLFD